jgi:hypothetical protein
MDKQSVDEGLETVGGGWREKPRFDLVQHLLQRRNAFVVFHRLVTTTSIVEPTYNEWNLVWLTTNKAAKLIRRLLILHVPAGLEGIDLLNSLSENEHVFIANLTAHLNVGSIQSANRHCSIQLWHITGVKTTKMLEGRWLKRLH